MCLIFLLLVFEAEKKKVLLCGAAEAGAGRGPGLAGGQDLGFVSVKWWDSPPPSGDLEPANQCAPIKKPARELRSLRAPKFEKSPRRLHQ